MSKPCAPRDENEIAERLERAYGPRGAQPGSTETFREGGQTDLSTPRCASRHALRLRR